MKKSKSCFLNSIYWYENSYKKQMTIIDNKSLHISYIIIFLNWKCNELSTEILKTNRLFIFYNKIDMFCLLKSGKLGFYNILLSFSFTWIYLKNIYIEKCSNTFVLWIKHPSVFITGAAWYIIANQSRCKNCNAIKQRLQNYNLKKKEKKTWCKYCNSIFFSWRHWWIYKRLSTPTHLINWQMSISTKPNGQYFEASLTLVKNVIDTAPKKERKTL